MQTDVGEVNETLLSLTFKLNQQERLVGAAFVNMYERTFKIAEFSDNDHFSSLESLIIQLNNSSPDSRFKVYINMPSDFYKHKVEDVVKMCEVEYVVGNKKEFTASAVAHSLNSLLKEKFDHKIEESEKELGMAALNAAIEHMKLLQGKQNQFTLSLYTLNNFLRLDVAALKALNVFPQNSDALAGQAGSLFGLLNCCKTQIGSRLLKKWLKQPSTDRK